MLAEIRLFLKPQCFVENSLCKVTGVGIKKYDLLMIFKSLFTGELKSLTRRHFVSRLVQGGPSENQESLMLSTQGVILAIEFSADD